MIPAHKLVLVTWEDSEYTAGWTRNPPVITTSLCHSVGWLVSQNKNCLVLSAHLSDDQRCCDMTIPRRAIVSVKTLKSPR